MAFEKFKTELNEQATETTPTTVDFSRFDQTLDSDTLEKINAIQPKSFDIPDGTYHMTLDDLCLKENSRGSLMVACILRVVDGDYTNKRIYVNFFPIKKDMTINAFQLAKANSLLSALSANTIDVKFDGKWGNYNTNVIEPICAFSKANVGYYEVQYTTSQNGTYTNKDVEIVDCFGK